MSKSIDKWLAGRFKSAGLKKQNDLVVKSTRDILDVLVKKLDDKHFSEIKDSHNDDYQNQVDNTYHIVNSQVPEDFTKAVNSEEVHTPLPKEQDLGKQGISPKNIHKIGDNHYMIKPYYCSNNRSTPLSGFGIMTAKNLYNSAGLKHLIEEVSASDDIHGVPSTIHTFSTGSSPARDYKDAPGAVTKRSNSANVATRFYADKTDKLTNEKPLPKLASDNEVATNMLINQASSFNPDDYTNPHRINPLHARQIGVMDYLLGNTDRHANNLFISDDLKEGGFRDLLAIDHDRVFNYTQSGYETPHTSYLSSAMSKWMGDNGATSNGDSEYDEKLANWWGDNKVALYDELNRNLRGIKDENTRLYVRRNFDERFKTISDWASNYANNPISLFSPQLKAAPRTFYPDQERKDSIVKVLNNPDIDEVVKQIMKHPDNTQDKDFRTDLLMEIRSNPKQYKRLFDKLFVENSKLPEESKFLTPFWAKMYLDLIEGK